MDDPAASVPSAPVIERYAGSRNAYLPRHIPRNEVQTLKRVAVILPFSSTNPEVQKTTQGLYNAIQMALFEASVRNGTHDVVLMPRDANTTDPREVARRQRLRHALAAGGQVAAHLVALRDARERERHRLAADDQQTAAFFDVGFEIEVALRGDGFEVVVVEDD